MHELFEQFDQARLLALIEGELDETEEQALLARLEANPQIKAAVLQMRENRTALQEVADPALPRDFLAELEPLLARPMLFESSASRPGRYRRRHRRALRQKQWPRAVAAAVLLLALGGAVWVSGGHIMRGLNQLAGVSTEGDEPSRAARTEAPRVNADEPGQLASRDPQPFSPERGVLHHYRPDPVPLHQYALDGEPAADEPTGTDVSPSQVASLALVVEADDELVVEKAMRDVVGELGTSVAVVRNDSPRASGRDIGDGPEPPTIRPDADGLTRETADVDDAASLDAAMASYTPMRMGQIEGDLSLSPSREEQRRFADLGATHTFSVRNSRLNDVLGRLGGLERCATRLELLPEAVDAEPDVFAPEHSIVQRLRQQRAIRSALAGLRKRTDDPVVMLPVMVRPRPGR